MTLEQVESTRRAAPSESARLDAAAERLLAHPRFEQAMLAYLDHIVNWRQSLGLVNAVLNGTGMHIVNYVICLHFTADPDDPASGASFTRILDILQRREQCSARFLRTALSVLALTGQLHTVRSASDRRTKFFVPAPRLMKVVQQHTSKTLACLDALRTARSMSRVSQAISRECWRGSWRSTASTRLISNTKSHAGLDIMDKLRFCARPCADLLV